jgi:hypothetical protein
MPAKKTTEEEIPFRFKFSGNIIKKLGEESIANKNIALLELIKNSYDADATKVSITFADINSKEGKIIVSDNGDGMTSTELDNKWFNIATPNKSEKIINTTDRVPVGEKGIGRLSSESLGKETILVTKPKGKTEGYKILIDWTKYEEKGVLANEVINKGISIKKTKAESGTSLEISKLKHNWNDTDVQKSLVKDINILHPINSKPKNFSITTSLAIPGLSKPDKKFLSHAAYYVKVSLLAGNKLQYEFKSISGFNKKGEVKLEKNLYCGDASFELYYFYKTTLAFKSATGKDILSTDIKNANDILAEYSGIKLYRDGFRIKPFGEDGHNDWLGLDYAFQNNTMYPRNANVFGWVNISKKFNPKILDITTREGVSYNEAFSDLISFAKTSIKEVFVKFRHEVESHKKKAKKAIPKKKITNKVKAVPAVKKTTTKDDKLIPDLGSAYPQTFYTELVQEINDCYQSNYPNATFFLSRKLIENLIVNILEKRYPNNIGMYYEPATASHHKLSLLIKNLHSKVKDFTPNIQPQISKFCTEIGKFRKEANATAHNLIDYLEDKAELKQFKIKNLVQFLLNIYNSI